MPKEIPVISAEALAGMFGSVPMRVKSPLTTAIKESIRQKHANTMCKMAA